MYSIKKNLDKPNGTKETLIFFSVTGKGIKRFRVTTQITIHPKHWTGEKVQQVKKSYEDSTELNKILIDRESELSGILLDLKARNLPINKDTVETRLSWITKTKVNTGKLEKLFIEFKEYKKADVRETTLGKYDSLLAVLQEYEIHTGKAFHPNNYDIEEHKRFRDYCYDKRGNTNGGWDNTLSLLKTFLKWAQKVGYAEKTDRTDLKQFIRETVEKEINPLTKAELYVLIQAEGKVNGMLDDVRRMFVFMCLTGLRFGDMQRVSNSHIRGNKIHILTNKTVNPVQIPILPETAAIIRYYREKGNKGRLFPEISNASFNNNLRAVFEQLELNRIVEVITFVRKEIEREDKPLYDVVSSHDGRRTFITLALSAGMGAMQLMTITGHEKFESFERYVKFSETDVEKLFYKTYGEAIGEMAAMPQAA